MSTTEITRIEDVRVGDAVAMGRDGVIVSGTLESSGTSLRPIANWHMHFVGVGTLYGRDGWTLVSATREVPEWEPGTAGTATVGPKCRQARAYSVGKGALVEAVGGGYAVWNADDVHSFVPDDASRWAAQAKLAEADLDEARAEAKRLRLLLSRAETERDKECAEVERLRAVSEKAKQDARTIVGGGTGILVDGVQVIEAALFTRLMQERAARTLPTREQVRTVLAYQYDNYIDDGGAHAREGFLDDATARVLYLYGQGGAS